MASAAAEDEAAPREKEKEKDTRKTRAPMKKGAKSKDGKGDEDPEMGGQ
jgi:hypothetical protein